MSVHAGHVQVDPASGLDALLTGGGRGLVETLTPGTNEDATLVKVVVGKPVCWGLTCAGYCDIVTAVDPGGG